MKHSLSELKKMVKEHKKSIPMLSSGKNTLYAYALKHKLMEAEVHLENEKMHEKLSKKERDMAGKDLKEAIAKVEVKHPKKAMKKAEEEKPVEKPKMKHNLSEVQAIRKEKGVSLKEAWALYMNKQKK
jgi:hypothetical protein